MQNITIAKKIYFSSAFALALLAGMMVNDRFANDKVAQARGIADREELILEGISVAQTAFLNGKIGVRDMALADNDESLRKAYDLTQKSTQDGIDALGIPISVALKPAALEDIRGGLQAYSAGASEVLKSIRANGFKHMELEQVRDEYTRPAMALINKGIDASIGNARNFTADAKASVDRAQATADQIRGYVSIAIMLALIGTAIFLRRSVVLPIHRITLSMRSLAAGDTTGEIPFVGRSDEVGQMAATVEVFRQSAMANARLTAEAEQSRARAEADRASAQADAERDAGERLHTATSGLANGLRRLASGDLAFQLEEAFSTEFEGLRSDFNQSIRQLSATLVEVSQAVSNMDGGTREIADGTQDLSKRTEQQASSLEETAAALEQITANVAMSTKRTEEARRVASSANDSAAASALVVSHAEDAMRRIEESSQQISNIIGVIDEIAFQTNLLALNAGVEAARAGEAGKGFAVVAQEVRELAQRSAHAAKEIKALIQTSTSEVGNGVKLVRDASTSLKTISGFISEMNEHMGSIASSAVEQAGGLREINAAVNQMDQSTQQNAAMVEESTAAATTLSNEAQRLRSLIESFVLGERMSRKAFVRAAQSDDAAITSPVRTLKQRLVSAYSGSAAPTGHWEEF
ncbi:methyl-accepting chemotaxis protein [Agrobacterium rosae]|uniref:methyl-accepting chemotaxis protein n=1 Tax=Agrobacterium rosae TaxID=1972867 RepID=UPI002033FC81|nr:methyl-accepting chemotaxis protein [Agrobacterium rosae]MCM2435929.1 HAMP domain-containing protein [Agrobacterium rosae]